MSVSGISGINPGALKRWAPNPSRASEQHLLAPRASGVNGPYGASNDNAPALLAEAIVLNDLTPTFTRANPVATDPVTGSVVGSNVRRRLPLTIGMRQVQGDLIESSRQNLQVYSQAFTPTWSGSLFSIAAAPGLAPDGTATATRLTFSNLNSYFGCSSACTAGTPNTRSIYYRRVNNDWAYILAYYDASNRATLWVNLATGQKGQQTTQGTASIIATDVIAVGGGWYRVSLTSQHASLGTPTFNIGHCSGDGVATATAGNSIDIWGAQVELGAFPSSYIPTTTAAVTRSADSLSVSLSSLVDSRTNYLTYSQDFSHANWSKASLAAPVAAQAPDGTMTAWTIAENSSTATHEFYGTVTATAAAWTMSVYLKAGGRKVRLAFGTAGYARGSRCDADPSNGTFANKVDTGGSVGTWSVTLIGGGWYRYSCAIDVASAATWYLDGILLGPGDATSYLGDGTSGVQVFGAQVSPTATAIEYIPTGASAITTGPTGLSLDHGTVLAIYVPYGSGNQAFDRRFAFGTVSGVQKFLIDHDTGNMRAVRYDNTTFRSASVAAVNPSALDARAGVYDSSGARLFRNGIQVAVSASPVMPYTAVDTMQIGSDASAAFHAHGYVALLYWPRALTADEIARVARVSSAPIFAI